MIQIFCSSTHIILCPRHQKHWEFAEQIVTKMTVCMHAKSLQSSLTLCNPKPVVHQAPLSMGFSRQEYWSGLPCPSPGGLPDPGIEPVFPCVSCTGRWGLYHQHLGTLRWWQMTFSSFLLPGCLLVDIPVRKALFSSVYSTINLSVDCL